MIWILFFAGIALSYITMSSPTSAEYPSKVLYPSKLSSAHDLPSPFSLSIVLVVSSFGVVEIM